MASNSRPPSTTETVTADTEIRHLPPHVFHKLGLILDNNGFWKDLASVIHDPDSQNTPLFSANDIRVFEEQLLKRVSPTESLLKYWGTSGRNRPDVKLLVELLNTSGLLRAAHYVMVDLLKQEVPIVEPEIVPSPSASHDEILNHGQGVPCYSYLQLQIATRGFCDELLSNGGCLLGQGTFGVVFLAHLENGNLVAVKRLKNSVEKQFISELQVLRRFEHPNILPLLGYSVDGPYTCLVYEYLSRGSLQDCLSQKETFLDWTKRLHIAAGTAKGVNHLHVHESKPLVHRDIKSANILLDSSFSPKLGDFGLARLGSAGTSMSVIATTISGTSPYMSPEAFRGNVSTEMDVFSYGVVLLELLTGLPPYDPNREDMDLLSHVLENCDEIHNFLDVNAGLWNTDVADAIFQISLRCTKDRKHDRPRMAEIIPKLEEMCLSIT